MKNLALERIQKMKPYTPPLNGRAAYKGSLLDFNERTQPPTNKVIKELMRFVRDGRLQIYPEYDGLERRIAEYAGVNIDQIMITNGSDQGIDIIFRTFSEKGDRVMIPGPTFAMFHQCAQVLGVDIISPNYGKEDFSFPLEKMLDSIDDTVKLIVICNPNNPTGTLVEIAAIEKIAGKAKNAIVYLDEAYFEFSKITAVPLIENYPNIVITRTFSKAFGLASLRFGYVIATREHIAEMLKVRGPYDVNMVAGCAVGAALDDRENLEKYTSEVMNEAKPLVESFFTEHEIPFYPSAANFILFKPDQPGKIYRKLVENGVRVRPQSQKNLNGMLRVSIGTVNQMKKFITAYENILAEHPNNSQQKYAILDRDGTLIFEPRDTRQIDSIQKLEILDGVIAGLQKLRQRGYKLMMVSNQDGLGTPFFPSEQFEGPHRRMLKIFSQNGIEFELIFICPHLPDENCHCRKPRTGLLKEVLLENCIDTDESFVCGDRESDRRFAENLGIRFVPVPTNGNFLRAITPILTDDYE